MSDTDILESLCWRRRSDPTYWAEEFCKRHLPGKMGTATEHKWKAIMTAWFEAALTQGRDDEAELAAYDE